MDSYTNERQREVQELFSEFWRVYRARFLPHKPALVRWGSKRRASGPGCCSVERAVRIRGGSASSRRGSVRARRRRGVVHLLAHGGVAELAYAGDLKSSAFGIVGSSPTAPTMRVMAPATGPFFASGPAARTRTREGAELRKHEGVFQRSARGPAGPETNRGRLCRTRSPTAPIMRVAFDTPLKLQCTWATSMHLRNFGASEKTRCT